MASDRSYADPTRFFPEVAVVIHDDAEARAMEDQPEVITFCPECAKRESGKSRTQSLTTGALPAGWVPGEGDREAACMVVGEAPGEVEWKLKRPFVGPTGTEILRPTLLDVGINPTDIYITNIVKIWPRNDNGKTRRPHRSEIKLALPYLEDEIRDIAPRCILALGNVANKTLTDCIDGINAARGQWRPLASGFGVRAQVLATFHPADVPGRKRKPEPSWRADLAQFARCCRGGLDV